MTQRELERTTTAATPLDRHACLPIGRPIRRSTHAIARRRPRFPEKRRLVDTPHPAAGRVYEEGVETGLCSSAHANLELHSISGRAAG